MHVGNKSYMLSMDFFMGGFFVCHFRQLTLLSGIFYAVYVLCN
jgi:hypothetical protein